MDIKLAKFYSKHETITQKFPRFNATHKQTGWKTLAPVLNMFTHDPDDPRFDNKSTEKTPITDQFCSIWKMICTKYT